MKQLRRQETHPKTDETPSNNEDKKKNTTMIEVRGKKLLEPKAGERKRTQCNEASAASFQHTRRIIEVHQQQIPDSYATVDIKK